MRPRVIFLDDGGVMNESRVRGEQWRHLVGEYFSPRLGGTREAWAAANRAFTDELFDPANWAARLAASPDYQHFDFHYQLDWLSMMFRLVGVPLPAAQDGYHLARQATAYITCRVRASFPGVVEAIRQLHQHGYTLYTASGEPSWDLEGYLGGMDVRACFTRLYGPDLVDTFKIGPAYYERIFVDAGVDPADALVIDDSAQAVTWARAAGAAAIQVVEHLVTAPDRTISSLAELPALLAAVERR